MVVAATLTRTAISHVLATTAVAVAVAVANDDNDNDNDNDNDDDDENDNDDDNDHDNDDGDIHHDDCELNVYRIINKLTISSLTSHSETTHLLIKRSSVFPFFFDR